MKKINKFYFLATTILLNFNIQEIQAINDNTLKHWPSSQAKKLNEMITKNAFKGNYAVFDMDNTSYQYDLTESLLPYLEQKGILTRNNLDPSLKIIPFKDTPEHKESLYSYYLRLCAIDNLICYPWIAQSFSGLSLDKLKQHVDTMIREQTPIPVQYYSGDKVKNHTIYPPKIFPAMVELYNALQKNGIDVYVITAANEEIVRMVASDPKYGYNVKPENIFGVNVLLKDKINNQLSTSHIQIKQKKYNQAYTQKNMQFTSYLINPMTWYEGKYATIIGWIDQWKKPILVAGDSPISDGYMLLNGTDVKNNGIRIWVDRKSKYTNQINTWKKSSAKKQQSLHQSVTADKNWIIVKPSDLHNLNLN